MRVFMFAEFFRWVSFMVLVMTLSFGLRLILVVSSRSILEYMRGLPNICSNARVSCLISVHELKLVHVSCYLAYIGQCVIKKEN